MKKRICAVLMAVLLFVAIPFTAFANPAAVAVGKFLGEWVLGELLSMVVYKIPDLIDGSDNDYSGFSSTAILAYWDDILDETTITEEDLRTHLPKITSEEYYWMFADCNASIDDIVAYCFGTSDKSGTAFETVNTFVTTYGLSEADLRALFDLVYTHRTEVYDFTAYTMRVGVTIDDICAYCFSNGIASDNTSSYVDDGGNAVVSGELFNDVIKRLNEQYGPKVNKDTVIISWKDDPYWSNTASNPRGGYLTVFEGANLWCGQGWYDVYMVPFYYDGTEYYYSEFQYYYYMSAPVQDSSGANVIMVNCDTLSYVDGETATFTDLYDRATGNYFDFCLPGFLSTGNQYIGIYPSIAAIGAGKATSTPNFEVSIADQFYNGDFEAIDKPYTKGTALGFNLPPTSYNTEENIGFICSSEPISIDYNFKEFPTNYYVTVNGDNIYNYTITNPDTGESTTINYYITNNYSFPDSDDDGGESGGTTSGDVNVSGDVTVSGDIDVGGKVDINVDVNINDNSSSGGSTESGSSYIDGEDINLDDYIEKTPEIANGFMSYMEKIMSWLPADILGVMILGVVVAVWCRLAGR